MDCRALSRHGNIVGVPGIQRFVALGDSFTEGLADLRPDGTPRGWADLVADVLAGQEHDFSYANLAVRSLRIDAIVDHQVPIAVALRPDLASIAAGANDLLGLRVDVGHVVRRLDEAVRALRETGAQVVVFRLWSDDRLHLSTVGHRHIARIVLEAIGREAPEAWRVPDEPPGSRGWVAARAAELAWSRQHLVPWAVRKVRGRSLGDGLSAKYPELVPWEPADS